jgi:hypothetical protein
MKMKSKSFVFILVAFVLAISIASVVEAGVMDKLAGFYDFEKSYDKNPKAWDFLMFSIIFNLIIWLGLIKAFPDNKGVTYILALVLGVLFGLAALKADMSLQFFIPFVKNAMFFIIFFIVFFLLLKFEMNKFWAIILALVITFVAFNMMGLFGKVKVGDIDLSFGQDSETLEDMQYTLDKLALEYNIEVSDEDDISAKVTKLRDRLRQEQEHLSALVKNEPNDEAAKLRLKRVREILLNLNKMERKGKELEKKAADATAAASVTTTDPVSGVTTSSVPEEEVTSLKEELKKVQEMKVKNSEDRKRKFVMIKELLKKIKDIEKFGKITSLSDQELWKLIGEKLDEVPEDDKEEYGKIFAEASLVANVYEIGFYEIMLTKLKGSNIENKDQIIKSLEELMRRAEEPQTSPGTTTLSIDDITEASVFELDEGELHKLVPKIVGSLPEMEKQKYADMHNDAMLPHETIDGKPNPEYWKMIAESVGASDLQNKEKILIVLEREIFVYENQ